MLGIACRVGLWWTLISDFVTSIEGINDMIKVFLLITLGISPLLCHQKISSPDQDEAACPVLLKFESSIKSALIEGEKGPICLESEPLSKYVTKNSIMNNLLCSWMYNSVSGDSQEVSRWNGSWRRVSPESSQGNNSSIRNRKCRCFMITHNRICQRRRRNVSVGVLSSFARCC